MKNRTVLGIFFFLVMMTSAVFGSMVENSRQGVPVFSAISQPAPTHENAEPRRGLSLALLEIMADSLFGFNGGMNLWGYCDNNPTRWTDPYGKVIAIDDAAAILIISSVSGFTIGYLNSPAGQKVISDFKGFVSQQIRNVELTFDGIRIAWDSYIQWSKPKENIDNEWVDKARKENPNDPCKYLEDEYKKARCDRDRTQDAQKIKRAQKALGCRPTHLD